VTTDDRGRTVYTVAELNGSVRLLLASHFGTVWVEGEISNLSFPSSGHWYFSLKDADAQVRCAMFRGAARGVGFRPENGMRVLVRAQVSLYEPRGDYQLVADYLEQAGDGALRRAFEQLKQKLAAEGLFEPARKRPIPQLPRAIGVVTSATGAAIRDILSVLKRRFPAIPVILYPTAVQGSEAKTEIARALALADRLRHVEVIILARGGGSLEDLWAFNEETVARAIAACALPIISGIGHETDVTIADFVADLRAPTPSAAAEAASPDQAEWLGRLRQREARLHQRMGVVLTGQGQRLGFLSHRLRQAHPSQRLQRHGQRLDELELRLLRALTAAAERRTGSLATLEARLLRHHPRLQVQAAELRRRGLEQRLEAAMTLSLERLIRHSGALAQRLHSVSPLATLARGYAIVSRADDGVIVRSVQDVKLGDAVDARLADGRLQCRVESRG
jgi:exodeoxyribonuclease VII large subunit